MCVYDPPVFGVHVFLSLVCLKLLKFHRHLIYIDRFLSFPIFFAHLDFSCKATAAAAEEGRKSERDTTTSQLGNFFVFREIFKVDVITRLEIGANCVVQLPTEKTRTVNVFFPPPV